MEASTDANRLASTEMRDEEADPRGDRSVTPEHVTQFPVVRVLYTYTPPSPPSHHLGGTNRRVGLVGYAPAGGQAVFRTEYQWANTFRVDLYVAWEAVHTTADQRLGIAHRSVSYGIHPSPADRGPSVEGARPRAVAQLAQQAGLGMNELEDTAIVTPPDTNTPYLYDRFQRRLLHSSGQRIANLETFRPFLPAFGPGGEWFWFACPKDPQTITDTNLPAADVCVLQLASRRVTRHLLRRTSSRIVDLVSFTPSEALLLTSSNRGFLTETCVERWTVAGSYTTLACWRDDVGAPETPRFVGGPTGETIAVLVAHDTLEHSLIARVDLGGSGVLDDMRIPHVEAHNTTRLSEDWLVLYGRSNNEVLFVDMAHEAVRVVSPERAGLSTGEWLNSLRLIDEDGEPKLIALHGPAQDPECVLNQPVSKCEPAPQLVELRTSSLFGPPATASE